MSETNENIVQRSTTFKADDNTCIVIRTCKKSSTEKVPTPVKWTFDLDTWTEQELKEHAIRSLVIDAQRLWRDDKIASEQTLTKDNFATTRKAKVPSKKAALEFLATLSEEDREAFLAELP